MSSAEGVGIAPRLGASFAAVVILAVAANMIARETVVVIRTLAHQPQTAVVQWQSPPAPAPVAAPPMPAAAPPINGSRLTGSYSTATRTGYLAAKDSMQRATTEFQSASLRASRAQPALTKPISDYTNQGRALVDLADARRKAQTDYVLNTRVVAEDIC